MGVIGGADGPTAIFVSGSYAGMIAVACITVAAIIAMVYLWRKRKGK